jgi:hypothetical protein
VLVFQFWLVRLIYHLSYPFFKSEIIHGYAWSLLHYVAPCRPCQQLSFELVDQSEVRFFPMALDVAIRKRNIGDHD